MVQSPALPPGSPERFRSTIHGVVFGDRAVHVASLTLGDRVDLIPDPPGGEEEAVWVHSSDGDPLGHLPAEISTWLSPWIRSGGHTRAVVLKVGGPQVPSWRRLVVEVECLNPG